MGAVDKIAGVLDLHFVSIDLISGGSCVNCGPAGAYHEAEAVVAAIRAMSPSEQAELIGGEVITLDRTINFETGEMPPIKHRVVGPWITEGGA